MVNAVQLTDRFEIDELEIWVLDAHSSILHHL